MVKVSRTPASPSRLPTPPARHLRDVNDSQEPLYMQLCRRFTSRQAKTRKTQGANLASSHVECSCFVAKENFTSAPLKTKICFAYDRGIPCDLHGSSVVSCSQEPNSMARRLSSKTTFNFKSPSMIVWSRCRISNFPMGPMFSIFRAMVSNDGFKTRLCFFGALAGTPRPFHFWYRPPILSMLQRLLWPASHPIPLERARELLFQKVAA